MGAVKRVWQQETVGWHGKLALARLLGGWLPPYVGNRWRTLVLRSAGFNIGKGTFFWGWPTITGMGDVYSRLLIGEECGINLGVLFNLGAEISIGDNVAIAHEVMVLTETHEIGTGERRAGMLYARAVCIGSGVWIGARAILLPGVTIGDRAIIAAGSMVNRDVPPDTVVGGVPARVLRWIKD